MGNISISSTLDEYVDAPLYRHDILLLDDIQSKWARMSFRLAGLIALLIVFAFILPLVFLAQGFENDFNKGGYSIIVFVLVSALFFAFLFMMAIIPISMGLLSKRYGFELSIGDSKFHVAGTRQADDFEFCVIDPAKVAYHPQATLLLNSIKAMGRDPAVFEYRLIKKMVSL